MIYLYSIVFLGTIQLWQDITVKEYRAKLIEIRQAIEASSLEQIHDIARSLATSKISYAGKNLTPDMAVIEPLAEVRDIAKAQLFKKKISALIEALQGVDDSQDLKSDRTLLDRLRKEEAQSEIKKEGNLEYPNTDRPGFMQALGDKLSEILSWIGRQISQIIHWLLNLFFSKSSGAGISGISLGVIILVVIITILLGIFGFIVLSRNKIVDKKRVDGFTSPVTSIKDEDPLSRTSLEWERFAKELIAQGRFREAVRAWYHALLTTLFRTGFLHHRKERTNWEYVNSLSPSLVWRPDFVEATRRFEEEWYGRRNTDRERIEIYALKVQKILGFACKEQA